MPDHRARANGDADTARRSRVKASDTVDLTEADEGLAKDRAVPVGNRAMARLLQAKRAEGQPDSSHRPEPDRVTETVAGLLTAAPPVRSSLLATQRQPEDEELQTAPDAAGPGVAGGDGGPDPQMESANESTQDWGEQASNNAIVDMEEMPDDDPSGVPSDHPQSQESPSLQAFVHRKGPAEPHRRHTHEAIGRSPGETGQRVIEQAPPAEAKAAALKVVEQAPPVPDEAIPDGDAIAEAIAAGEKIGSEIGAAQGNPGVAAVVADEAKESPDDAPAPPDLQPVSDLGAYAAEVARGGGQAAEDPAAVAPAAEAPAAEAPGAGAGQAPKSNDATENWNTAKTVTSVGTTVGKLGSSATGAVIGAVTTGASVVASALGYVAGGLGAIASVFDIRSALSSRAKAKRLDEILADMDKAPNAPENEGLRDAIKYAIKQKYSKSYTRALKALTGLTSAGIGIAAIAAGVGLAAIVSNPVGWVIGAAIVGVCGIVGLGIMAYKLGHKLLKWYRGDLGVRRRKMAMRLYDSVIAKKKIAVDAVDKLGLNSKKMQSRAAAVKGQKVPETKHAKGVKARLERHHSKVIDSQMLVEKHEKNVTRLEAYVATMRGGGKGPKKVQKELKKGARAALKKAKSKLAAREKKQDASQVQAEWKTHSKTARSDIALIERKLKK